MLLPIVCLCDNNSIVLNESMQPSGKLAIVPHIEVQVVLWAEQTSVKEVSMNVCNQWNE
jgi:hypothetical protein